MSQVQRKVFDAAAKKLTTLQVKRNRMAEDQWDFPNWLAKYITVKKDRRQRPYSFAGYEPYFGIAQDLHLYHENWFLKASQIGFSTLMIGWALYLPYWRGLDSGYALPDKVMIKPFMKTRFGKEQIDMNAELQAIYSEHETDMYYDCGPNYLYFLGVNVISDTMSRPMEMVALDEVTIIKDDAVDWIEDRLGAASFGQKNGFTMEMYPGGAAHVGFEAGRQNVFVFKCPHCGQDDQILEEIFYQSSMENEMHPRCVKKLNGAWQVVCVKCEKPYSRRQSGRWVAKHPERESNSYRVPQLIFDGMDLDRLMRRWQKSVGRKSLRAKLHCTLLGIPDAGDLQRIQKDVLVKLARNYAMTGTAQWSVGGCDVGNTCHAAWADLVDGEKLRFLWWEEIDSDKMVEVLSERITRMGTAKFVIDAKPFAPQVRALAERFPGIVVMHDYTGDGMQEDEKEHAGRAYQSVKEDRESALDYYCDLFSETDPRVMFPAQVYERERGLVDFGESVFANHHLRGSQKDEVEDKRLGKKIHKYRKNVDNHYFMAGNYARTALVLLSQDAARFVGMAPVFGSMG